MLAGNRQSYSSSLAATSTVQKASQPAQLVAPQRSDDFSLTVSPGTATVVQGNNATAIITVALVSDVPEPVALSACCPSVFGGTFTFTPASGTPSSTAPFTSTMNITTGTINNIGNFPLTVTATTASGLSQEASFGLTIESAFDFSLSINPGTGSVVQGNSASATVIVARVSGSAQTVSLSSCCPSVFGGTVIFTPASGTPSSKTSFTSAMSITTGVATTGTFTITITATATGGLSQQATFQLIIGSAFDFSLTVSPGTRSVVQGNGASATVTVRLVSGSTQAVTLTDCCPGVFGGTVFFTPASGTPSSTKAFNSTMTITTAMTTVGSFTITITATADGGLSEQASFQLMIEQAFDFSLSVSPGTGSVAQSSSASGTVTVAMVSGSAQAVDLTACCPTLFGGTVTFSPTSGTPSSTTPFTSTMKVGSGTITGTFAITITATATGGFSKDATFELNVTSPRVQAFDFSLSVTPGTGTVVQGNTAIATVTVALVSGSAQSVTLTDCCPGAFGGTVTFTPTDTGTPTSTVPFTATMSITSGTVDNIGSPTVTVYATAAGGLVKTVSFGLTIESAFDFSLSVNPGTGTVVQGNAATAKVTVALVSGSAQSVTLTDCCPGVFGGTVTFAPTDTGTPSSTTNFTATMSITTGTAANVGSPTVTVYATASGGLVKAVSFGLTIESAFDFSLSVSPGTGTVVQGNAVTATVTVALVSGSAQSVTLTDCCPGVFGGTVTFTPTDTGTPSSATPFTAIMSVSTGTIDNVGSATVTVYATAAGGLVKTVSFDLAIRSAFDFSLTVGPGTGTVVQGNAATAKVTVALVSGSAQSVTLTDCCPGVFGGTVTFAPTDTGTPSSTTNFTATMSVTTSITAMGIFSITIYAKATGGLQKTVSFSLTIQPFLDYTLAVKPSAATVTRGSTDVTTKATVNATLTSGTATSVTLLASVSGPSSGVTATFNPVAVTPTSTGATSTMTVTILATAAPGDYSIVIFGSPSGASSSSVTFTLTVVLPFDYSLAWSPPSGSVVAGGNTVTYATALLTSGSAVALSCSVTVPPGVAGLAASTPSFSITPASPAASQTETVSTTTSTPTGGYTFNVSCSGGGVSHTAAFVLTVTSTAFTFNLAWSPASASITAGDSTKPSVVATLVSGQSSSVSCSITLPASAATGLSATPLSFSLIPSNPAATQVVTIATTPFTPTSPTGGYIITANCGGLSASFALTVAAAPFTYTVAWSPTSGSITAGGSTKPSVVATLTSGQTAAIACSVSLPMPIVTGLSATPLSFSLTPSISGVSQAVTIATTVFTPASPTGGYIITVNCGSVSANFVLTVAAAPFAYTLAWSPASASITSGGSTIPSVVATLTSGQTTSVSCSITLPTAAVTGLSTNPTSFSLVPSAAGASRPVTLSTTVFTPSSPTGGYAITANCGGVSASFALTVTAAPFAYTVAWVPNTGSVTAGSSAATFLVATLTSGTATSLSCSVTVPSVTGLAVSTLSFSLTPTISGASQAETVSTSTSTPPSPASGYTISVSCSGSGVTHSANFVLTVTAPFNFSLAWSPPSGSAIAGGSAPTSVTTLLTSGSAVALSCSVTVPSGAGITVSASSFSINPASPAASQAETVSTTTSTPPPPAGGYTISVSCSGGGATHSANFVLTVTSLHKTKTSLSCGLSSVQVNSPTTCTATVTDTSSTPTSPTGSIVFTSSGAGTFSSSGSCTLTAGSAPGSASCQVTYTPSNVGSGTHTMTSSYHGDSGHDVSQGSFDLIVTAAPSPDFAISANPASLTLAPESAELCEGQTTLCDDEGTVQITITALNGFAGQVTLSVTSSPHLDTELTKTILGPSGTSTLTVEEATPGSHVLTVTGTSGSLSHSVTINVTVREPQKLKCGGEDKDCDIESDDDISNENFEGHTMHFTLSGVSGRKGAANVTIVKLAVPDIKRVKVFIDRNELSGSDLRISEDGKNYHIYFTFTFHSNVNVDIDLNPSQTILGLEPTLFYGIIATLVIAAGVAVVTGLRRRKRSLQSTK